MNLGVHSSFASVLMFQLHTDDSVEVEVIVRGLGQNCMIELVKEREVYKLNNVNDEQLYENYNTRE
jgi:hypothetical protein